MVALNRIYTRTGDDGASALIGGKRLRKDHPRMQAMGDVDEANAAIGLARLCATAAIDAVLDRIQHDLFDLGADLATPAGYKETALRITPVQVTWLEKTIDRHNASLAPLQSFVLPGGSACSASLHLARTVVRRAERSFVALSSTEKMNAVALQYLNRLSDLLFVLARAGNAKGKKDVLWIPGKGSRVSGVGAAPSPSGKGQGLEKEKKRGQ